MLSRLHDLDIGWQAGACTCLNANSNTSQMAGFRFSLSHITAIVT